jgi:glucosamine 6-phosphate synthetase-like amidotransferase/phosphosugar isomerase protein
VRDATSQLHGAYAIAVFSKHEPQRLIGARVGSPLVVGLATARTFASDALALAGITDRFIFLEEGDVVELTPAGVRILTRDGAPVERPVRRSRRRSARSSSARTGISCRRRSSSSRRPSPRRFPTRGCSIRLPSGATRRARSSRSTTC